MLLKASLERPSGSVPVILRNLSEDGALVRGLGLPEAGERVLFHRQGLCVPSRVAWVHREHAGINFDSPLFPRELLRHVPPPCEDGPEQQMIERWAAEAHSALSD